MKAVPLELATDEALCGGKACHLGEALRAKLPVPRGYVLPVALVEALQKKDNDALLELKNLFASFHGQAAARSSGVGEDAKEHSFAGQYLSCMNVRSFPELLRAINTICDSAKAPAVQAYRKQLGLDPVVQMAVVIQEQIRPDCAGVMFTQNPVNGADEIVIEASWGLGKSVVDGAVIPDQYRLSKTGEILSRQSGVKDRQFVTGMHGGVEEQLVPKELVSQFCVKDNMLQKLAALADAVEVRFGVGQDIEWAVAEGQVWLLQKRLITSRMPRQK